MGILIVATIRLVAPIAVLRWPLARALIAIVADAHGASPPRRVGVFVHGDTGSPTFPRNLTRRLGAVAFLEIDGVTPPAWLEQLRSSDG